MTPTLRLACALVAALMPPFSLAQTPPIKPGLWEVQSENSTGGQKTTQPSDRLQNLPPAVRAQVEASMKQKGIAVGGDGLNKICFTKESMDPARFGNAASCKTEPRERTARSWKSHTVCTEPPMTLDSETVFNSSESYTVNTTMTMTVRGETKTSRRTIRAKWLGADCGDLKPFDLKR